MFVFSLVWINVSFAQVTGPRFNLQGRILKNDGVPVEAALVVFKVRIRSPGTEDCVLYEESHEVPMTDSDGVFTLSVGGGTRETAGGPEHSVTLGQALSNRTPIAGSLTCAGGGSSYTPMAGHSRRIEINFDDGTGFQKVSQLLNLQSVPYAMNADSFQGRGLSDFLSPNSTTAALTQSNLEGVFASTAYVNELIALIAGNSAQYVKANGAGFLPTAAVSYNNQRITNLSNPTAAQDAATKDYADKQIGGKIVDVTITNLAAGDSGKVLSWDGSKWVATMVSTSDATKLPLAGGTMTGAITMGGNNLLQTGHITMNPGRYLHLGTYDDSAEATLVGSLTGAHKGAIWYNTTDNVIKHWNGSAVIASGPIADNAVTTAKIADGAVTTPKLFANPGINRIVATDGTLGSTLAPMTCATVGHVLKWTMANGFQCAADDGGQWTTSGSNISFSSGNVGIGTTSPSSPVHVSTAVTNTYTTSSTSLALPAGEMLRLHNSNNALSSYSGLTFVANRADGVQQRNFIGGVSNGGGRALDMVLGSQTNGATYSEWMRIVGLTGNVGIGTANPAVGLDLSGRTDAVRLPLGASSQRPTAANGLIRYNTDTNKFEAYENGAWTNMIGAGGTVTSVTAGAGLTGGTITSSGTLAVNVGTGANQIVQLDASSRLPAVDGSQLTNLSAAQITAGTLPIARGGTNSTTALNNNRLMISSSGAIVEAPALTNGQLLIGSTGAAPVAAALLAGTGISITNGAGSITIATTGAPPTGSAGGDLTGTYPNPTIANNAVTAAKIADGAVTTPKLFTNPGINRIVGTDGTLGSTLAPMSCATVGHVLKWTVNGFQCAADDNTGSQWTTSGSNISYSAGNVGIGTASPSAALMIIPTNASTIPLVVQDISGGTSGRLQEWRTSSGTASAHITNFGNLVMTGASGGNPITVTAPGFGSAGVYSTSTGSNGAALHGSATNANAFGVFAEASNPTGTPIGIVKSVITNQVETAANFWMRKPSPITSSFGGRLNFQLSADSELNRPDVAAINWGWEVDQVNATTDRDSYLSFSTMVDNARAERMRISSAGNVGIGTSSPGAALAVVGGSGAVGLTVTSSNAGNTAVLTNTASGGGLRLDGVAGNPTAITVSRATLSRWTYGVNGTAEGGSNAGSDFTINRFNDAGSSLGTALFIRRSDGNVGIGTTAPAVSLDLNLRTDAIRLPAGSAAQRPTGAEGLMRYNTDTSKFEAYEGGNWTNVIGSGGTVTSVAAGTGLTGGTITTSGTLAVNVGTGANQIVQLDSSSRLPAVNGSLLTNLSAAQITAGTLPIARGGTNSATALNNNRLMVSSSGAIVEAPALTNGQLLIGSTGAAPVAAALLAGTGISITNGAGSITIATTGAPPTGAAGGDLTGTYPNPTINANAVTTTTIANNAVTTAKVADAAITTPKLFTNPGRNRIVGTDATTGATLAPMTCSTDGHVLKWSVANGFQCAADDNTGSQWATSGSDISYSTGSVGIGTTAPEQLLHVRGRTVVGNTTSPTNGGRVLEVYTGNTSSADAGIDVTRGGTRPTASSTASLRLRSDGSGNYRGTIGFAAGDTPEEDITLLPNNRINLFGYTGLNPSFSLTLEGESSRSVGVERRSTADSVGAGLTLQAGGATAGATDRSGGTLTLASGIATGTGSSAIQFQTASSGSAGTTDNTPTTKMTIAGSGFVGVGTTSPPYLFSVTRSTGASTLAASISGANQFDQSSVALITQQSANESLGAATSKGWEMIARGNAFTTSSQQNDLIFSYWNGSSWSDSLTLDSTSGFVGVGTASPGADLHVVRSNQSPTFRIQNSDSTTSRNPVVHLLNFLGSASGGGPIIDMDNYGGSLGSMTATASGRSLGTIRFRGSGTTGVVHGATINAQTSETFSNTSAATSLQFATTQSGATLPTTRMVIDPNGNVGIGTSSPRAALDVTGAILGRADQSTAATTINYASTNLMSTTNSCGAFAIHNLRDGGIYNFIVRGTTLGTCSFTAFSDAGVTGLTVRLPPDHGPTTSGKMTLYTFMVAGSDVFVTWIPGY